jgi:hypothetical protein
MAEICWRADSFFGSDMIQLAHQIPQNDETITADKDSKDAPIRPFELGTTGQ